MLGIFRIASLVVGSIFFVGCAELATPVAVLAPKPEHEGKEPTHIGVACAYKILWVFSFGDSHVREAKRQGGVDDIATVEIVRKVFIADYFPLNLYRSQCTEVSGFS